MSMGVLVIVNTPVFRLNFNVLYWKLCLSMLFFFQNSLYKMNKLNNVTFFTHMLFISSGVHIMV